VVQLLLEKLTEDFAESPSINPEQKKLGDVLHTVAYRGNENLVQRLLGKCINVEIIDHHGWTPSMVASACGHIKIASLLSPGAEEPTPGVTICEDGVTIIAGWFNYLHLITPKLT
jgi:ankyrin repeat protein